ncbi:DMT family transporter [Jannaschia seohaensis]|uniref:Threonine/homoserine efflux transporter RhtA n=1 Tax=Jannaschia seohaensis TaxID=475081 RepID=A0A2Y9C755_9RHOB|nr:DMT family transporter [Jannaschia seohaensis]PWJ20360.1 threonine/homoserine efflux transporter RhtA [Jannaschia seohaensis]SSA44413.1 Threonine/homoserine efflux transporter RhtA [Jannaschia seohaensis]
MTARVHVLGLDRPVLGMGLMLGFCVLAPMGDAIGKMLAENHAVMQIVLCRFAVQAAVLIPLVRATGRSFAMSSLGWRLTVLRTVLHVNGLWMMITALTYLPLADAIAIAFVMPFILLLLGHFLLGETVGRRRLTACAVGFGGTLMVMQPSFAAVGWPALYPLGVAVSFAGFMLVTRRIAGEADPLAMQGMSGTMATVGLCLLYLILPSEGIFALTSISSDWTLWLVMGLLGTGAHLLMTWSLRFAEASTLAPMQYLEIPIAAIIGLIAFGDWPNGLALAGIGVTIGTGLYILWRENADGRARA